MIQEEPGSDLLADRSIAYAAAETVRKAQAVGLVPEVPDLGELTLPALKGVVARVREAGVAQRAARGLELAGPGDAEAVLRNLREIDASLEESPLPATEWHRLLGILGRDQLARLVGVSPSSVARYARQERRTPDKVAARLHFVALAVGDLAGAYNEIGIRRWFERKRTALGGRSPAELLAGPWKPEDEGSRRVRQLARALVAGSST